MSQLTTESIRCIVHDYMTEHSKKFGLDYWMKNKFCTIRQDKVTGNPCTGCESNAECQIASRLFDLYGDIAIQQVEITTMKRYISKLQGES